MFRTVVQFSQPTSDSPKLCRHDRARQKRYRFALSVLNFFWVDKRIISCWETLSWNYVTVRVRVRVIHGLWFGCLSSHSFTYSGTPQANPPPVTPSNPARGQWLEDATEPFPGALYRPYLLPRQGINDWRMLQSPPWCVIQALPLTPARDQWLEDATEPSLVCYTALVSYPGKRPVEDCVFLS